MVCTTMISHFWTIEWISIRILLITATKLGDRMTYLSKESMRQLFEMNKNSN